jgi:hypothetical protein
MVAKRMQLSSLAEEREHVECAVGGVSEGKGGMVTATGVDAYTTAAAPAAAVATDEDSDSCSSASEGEGDEGGEQEEQGGQEDMSWAAIKQTSLDGGLWVMKTAGILLYAMEQHRGKNAFMQLAFTSLSTLLQQHTTIAKNYLVTWSVSSLELGQVAKQSAASSSPLAPAALAIGSAAAGAMSPAKRRSMRGKATSARSGKQSSSVTAGVSTDAIPRRSSMGKTEERKVLGSPTQAAIRASRAEEERVAAAEGGGSPQDVSIARQSKLSGGERAITFSDRRNSSSGRRGSVGRRGSADGRRGSIEEVTALQTGKVNEGALGKTLDLLREYHYFSGFVTEALSFLSLFCPEYHPHTVEVVLLTMRFHAKRAAVVSKGLAVLSFLCQEQQHSKELVKFKGVEQLLAVRDEFGVTNREQKMPERVGFKRLIQAQIEGNKLDLGDKSTDILRQLLCFPVLIKTIIQRHSNGHALPAFVCAVLQQSVDKKKKSPSLPAAETGASAGGEGLSATHGGRLESRGGRLEEVTRKNSLLSNSVSLSRRKSFITAGEVPMAAILESSEGGSLLDIARIASGLIESGVVPHLLTAIDLMLSDLRAQHIACMAVKLLAATSVSNMHAVCNSCMAKVCDVPTRLNQPTQNSLPTTTNQTTELNTEPLNETAMTESGCIELVRATTNTERVAALLGSVQAQNPQVSREMPVVTMKVLDVDGKGSRKWLEIPLFGDRLETGVDRVPGMRGWKDDEDGSEGGSDDETKSPSKISKRNLIIQKRAAAAAKSAGPVAKSTLNVLIGALERNSKLYRRTGGTAMRTILIIHSANILSTTILSTGTAMRACIIESTSALKTFGLIPEACVYMMQHGCLSVLRALKDYPHLTVTLSGTHIPIANAWAALKNTVQSKAQPSVHFAQEVSAAL